jgi:hypothetical protein
MKHTCRINRLDFSMPAACEKILTLPVFKSVI